MEVLGSIGKITPYHDLILTKKGGGLEYVIARNYNPSAPVGNQWDNGRYFYDIQSVAKAIIDMTSNVSYERLKEISCKAIEHIAYLSTEAEFNDFLRYADIDIEDLSIFHVKYPKYAEGENLSRIDDMDQFLPFEEV